MSPEEEQFVAPTQTQSLWKGPKMQVKNYLYNEKINQGKLIDINASNLQCLLAEAKATKTAITTDLTPQSPRKGG